MTVYHHALGEFEQALGEAQPLLALREAVRTEVERGADRQELLAELDGLRHHLRAAGRESERDMVMEVMDALLGYTSPHLVL